MRFFTRFIVIIIVSSCLLSRAGIQLETETLRINGAGGFERAGFIRLTVNGDDFPAVSPTQPIFIRLRLDRNAVLAQTLVDFEGIDDEGKEHHNEPIYLAMRSQSYGTLVAYPESVAIVRWIKGEPSIWLRIQSDSRAWFADAGDYFAPNPFSTVTFELGLTAGEYEMFARENQDNYQFNRSGNGTADFINRTTSIMVDFRDAILDESDPALHFDAIAFHGETDEQGADTGRETVGVTTVADWRDIVLGSATTINFVGAHTIARGSTSTHRLMFPWVCDNATFQSTLVLTNRNPEPVEVHLTARRSDGTQGDVLITLPGHGFYRQEAGDLFFQFGPGPGYGVVAESNFSGIKGTCITRTRLAGPNRSPSQAPALHLDDADHQLVFHFLPQTTREASAPVMMNVGDEPASAQAYFYAEDGSLIARAAFADLDPFVPYPILIDKIPDLDGSSVLYLDADQPVVGLSFIFDGDRQIGVTPAEPIIFDPPVESLPD